MYGFDFNYSPLDNEYDGNENDRRNNTFEKSIENAREKMPQLGEPIPVRKKEKNRNSNIRRFKQISSSDWFSRLPGIFRAALVLGGISVAFIILGTILSIFSNDPVVVEQSISRAVSKNSEEQSESAKSKNAEQLWREVQEKQSNLSRQRQLFLDAIEASRGIRWQNYVNQHCLQTGSCEDDPYTKLLDRRQAIVSEIKSLVEYGALSTKAETVEKFRQLDDELADIDAALATRWGTAPQHKVSAIDYLNSIEALGQAIGQYNNPVLRARRQQAQQEEK